MLLNTLVWPEKTIAPSSSQRLSRSAQAKLKPGVWGGGPCTASVARTQIWQWVNPYTIVVGHDVKSSFSFLRWAHSKVVDSLLLDEDIARQELLAWAMMQMSLANAPPRSYDDELDDWLSGRQTSTTPSRYVEAVDFSLRAVARRVLTRDIDLDVFLTQPQDNVAIALVSRDIIDHHAATKSLPAGVRVVDLDDEIVQESWRSRLSRE